MEQPGPAEVLTRLRLFEEMTAAGRRATERWGWSFLLWGVGPLIAMLWEARGPYPALAWPVILVLCVVMNGVVLKLRGRRGHAVPMSMRSVGAVWTSTGIAVLILAVATVWSGASDFRFLYVALFALAAVAHTASCVILKWFPQALTALAWWCAALAACFVPAARLQTLAAAALLAGNVGFGAWLTYKERSRPA
jgi:hypothetical protein